MRSIQDKALLNNGVEMPWLGLGVWKAKDGNEVIRAVQTAIAAGYRSIDTAAVYNNESGVGAAIRQCGVPREELFIATKLWNSNQGYTQTVQAFHESLQKLRLDYLDLYLIHWPVKETYKETWQAFLDLYEQGKIRAIGVSNFQDYHINELLSFSGIIPAVNQVELHPRLTQKPLLAFCKEKGIQVEAWSPLMRGQFLDHPVLMNLAKLHAKSVAQIILRWNLQNNVIVIPKSVTKQRIIENTGIFDFELSAEELSAIDSLHADHRLGADPNKY
ncbi:aldo/keto reductase [Paenibacillus taiwanensis]|uniref:aldo/keto reductase n=1 Tax=Paenibacillus taiwanensis TaxID=401638 RepID=UPI00048F5521